MFHPDFDCDGDRDHRKDAFGALDKGHSAIGVNRSSCLSSKDKCGLGTHLRFDHGLGDRKHIFDKSLSKKLDSSCGGKLGCSGARCLVVTSKVSGRLISRHFHCSGGKFGCQTCLS